ncbi:MAG: ATP-binding cassette domain-containing protein [Phycisphaerae bacterium]|nr:ATP-binding cassette domain-containing protein [Phycisphaerae bacterium]
MALVTLSDISISYGGDPVLAGVDFQIEPGERIALVGRNGSGKSTLPKFLAGRIDHELGEVTRTGGLRTNSLTQDVPHELSGSIYSTVAAGLGEVGTSLARYHQLCSQSELHDEPHHQDELNDLQHALEVNSAWSMDQEIVTMLSKMSLPTDDLFEHLSAGMKRRVLLARALVSRPDLLLLDEPTNHFDLQAILWLEEFLLQYPGALLFVTHDRAFLQRISTRIVEIDRGGLSSWVCDYNTFVQRKAGLLAAQAHENHVFDKRLKQEEAWVRRGVQGRRARNEGRRRALEEMRLQRRGRKDVVGTAKMQLQGTPASGRLVIEAKEARFAYGDNVIIDDFTAEIMRGDKIGIIGPNGSGKSTLLKVLLGELVAQHGLVRQGTRLEIAYFDQLHAELDETLTVQQNIAGEQQMITVNGKPRHVLGYMRDFLFTKERARSAISDLSGGERNRLLLAKLMTKPSNLLVLDEPTNDLDAETLELLEDLLVEYPGTVLMVSHDRAFLNNVVTSVLVLEGEGKIGEYVGGYDDWLRQDQARQARQQESEEPAPKKKKVVARDVVVASVKKKLTFKEDRELDALPTQIEKLEARERRLHETMSAVDFYKNTTPAEIRRLSAELRRLEQDLADALVRWEELETLRG